MLSYICGTTTDVRSSIIAQCVSREQMFLLAPVWILVVSVRRFRTLWGESSGGDRQRMDAAVARLVLTDAFVRVNFVLGLEFLYRYTLVSLVPAL